MRPYRSLFESTKQRLEKSFQCTDADENGIFPETCPFGEIDTNEFSQFIHEIEQFPLTEEEFRRHYSLPKFDPISVELRQRTPEFRIFGDVNNKKGFVVLFDGDVHYIYEKV
jgi:hypothetical protein